MGEVPGPSYPAEPPRAPLHLADSPPADKLYVTTYCGRLLDEVMWATPELAEHPSGFLPTKPRCRTCLRSLARRRRG
jgi:hypothetical protein